MLSTSYSAAILGVQAQLVTVEAEVSMGLPALVLVGQASGAVYEGRERVRSALGHCGHATVPRKQVVNLAPAQLKKDSAGLDLPITMALLAAHEVIPAAALQGILYWAELGLDGRLRPVSGSLLVADLAREREMNTVVVAPECGQEAALIPGIKVLAPRSLKDLVAHVRGDARLAYVEPQEQEKTCVCGTAEGDMRDVRGLTLPRLALEVLAAGGHNLLMWGSPGVGKTMLARRARGLCPSLDKNAAIERTKIDCVAHGKVVKGLDTRVPFRAPHHSVSAAGLLGGGRPVRPGEVSLAHRGILFLDELPEFSRLCIEGLREPLEEGAVSVVRAEGSYRFPARFQVIAAMNPCPCGYFGDPVRQCTCSLRTVSRYQQKVSGPFVDRMDLVIPLSAQTEARADAPTPESSEQVRERVIQAQERQRHRLASWSWRQNAFVPANHELLDTLCPMTASAHKLLEQAAKREGLSLRAQHRIRKVSQTLCDLRPELCPKSKISDTALALALQLRRPFQNH